jgi:predicted acylesterase/phospholipase RssA
MSDSHATATALLAGERIGFADLLRLFAELVQSRDFRLAREVAEQVAPTLSSEEQRVVRGRALHFADRELAQLLGEHPLPVAALDAPFATLAGAETWPEQWWHARQAVARLRGEGRRRGDGDLERWRGHLGRSARALGAAVAERPGILLPARLEPLVTDLKAVLEFGLARTVIEATREAVPKDRREWFWQQLALCTYKDEVLVPRQRFRLALEILDEIPRAAPETASGASAETLALRGAVYKRMWEVGGQVEDLYEAARWYLAAWSRDPAGDLGYGGVNAAYLMDVLAEVERPITAGAGDDGRPAETWATRARALREAMKREVPRLAGPTEVDAYWRHVTMAEIHWGLGDWEEAGAWLARARTSDASEWELQTSVKQLVALARLHDVPALPEGRPRPEWHPAWQALDRLMAEDTASVATYHRGKVGLALSGGGFRASLFHLGVLARLAEMDALRSVEVLSTVSGGSIVGAHYYLALQDLLHRHPDGELTREHYVDLVKQVQEDFLVAVQRNLRTRGLTNLPANLRFVFGGAYTRSNRMGELYEREIYARVRDGHAPGSPRRMRDLLISPRVTAPDGSATHDRSFSPRFSNWRRRAKVPILLLNTTSLNTGHSWHFTARWLGEPPGLLGPENETIPRYRRLWYDEAPTEALQNYRLGYAVAASACVPALFEPLELPGLYPGRTVRLVDGGVHDNQGVAGLLDESCTLILCSDASGQMADNPTPSNTLLGVPLRANSILMNRVREAQYLDLTARVDSRSLRGLFFVHLRQDLAQEPVTWIGGTSKTYRPRTTTTSYGVDRELQARLAEMRTDLDSFSEVEACALMASGYLMTTREFERLDLEHAARGGGGTWGDFDVRAPSRGSAFWKFLELAPLLALSPDSSDRRRVDLGRQLRASSARFFKAFELCRSLSLVGLILLAALAGGVAYFVHRNWEAQIDLTTTVGAALLTLLLVVGGLVWRGIRFANPEAVMRSWLFKGGLALGGWVLANLHVTLIDPIFLRRGRVARLMRLPPD